MNELIIEFRKLTSRKDFFLSFIIVVALSVFMLLQIVNGGSFVTLHSEGETTTIPLVDILQGIVGMMNYLGLIGVIIAILCWNSFGKEFDQKVIHTYFLNSKSKNFIFMSKISVISTAFILILLGIVFSAIVTFLINDSSTVTFTNNLFEYKTILKLLLLISLGAIFYISLAGLLSIRWGSIGVLAATVGFSILSSIIKSNEYIEKYLPINLMDIDKANNLLANVGLLVTYIIIINLVIWLILKSKEV